MLSLFWLTTTSEVLQCLLYIKYKGASAGYFPELLVSFGRTSQCIFLHVQATPKEGRSPANVIPCNTNGSMPSFRPCSFSQSPFFFSFPIVCLSVCLFQLRREEPCLVGILSVKCSLLTQYHGMYSRKTTSFAVVRLLILALILRLSKVPCLFW